MMDVDRLVEDVARAIYKSLGHEDTDPWAEAVARRDRLGLSEALTLNQTACVHAARSAILATLRGVREADGGMMRRAFAAMNDTPSGTWKRLKAEKLPERELFAAKMHPRYTAMIDHLIKTVEG
jgi:hypothetical protein